MSTYTVQSGDTLYAIAQKTMGNGNLYSEIAKLNNIEDPNTIHVGMVLQIPGDSDTSSSPEPAPATASAALAPTVEGTLITADQLKQIVPLAKESNITLYVQGLNDQMAKFENQHAPPRSQLYCTGCSREWKF